MTRRPTNPTDIDRLASLIRDAVISLCVEKNPHHDNPEWKALHTVGYAGYRLVAEQLIDQGVKLEKRI